MDLIDRQKAIDALIWKIRPHNNGDGTITMCVMSEELVRKTLNNLPSAQPEIVRCKDCKWVEHYGTDGNASYWCKNWDGGTDADGFCYEVERRTE